MSDLDITLEQAIAQLSLRKRNLDHIYKGDSPTARAIRAVREDEIDRTLEIVKRVNVVATKDDWGNPDSTLGASDELYRYDPKRC